MLKTLNKQELSDNIFQFDKVVKSNYYTVLHLIKSLTFPQKLFQRLVSDMKYLQSEFRQRLHCRCTFLQQENYFAKLK